MILLIRLVPLAVGLLEAVVFWQQRQDPSSYPWVVILGLLALPAGALVISWGRIGLADLSEKMAPTLVLLASLAFALLLVEGSWQSWILVTIASLTTFLSLEVLFLLIHHPSAYPVNGISRLNIGTVPFSVWYAVSTSTGLITFIHTDRIWHIVLCIALGAILFRTTGHPMATKAQNRIWVGIGASLGLEIGVLGLLLPVSLSMQGFIAAALFCGALRVRRYLYDPKPSLRMAWTEATSLLTVMVVALSTAKWF